MSAPSAPAYGRDAALWFGVLGGPVAWLLQFQANYTLVPWACARGAGWIILAVAGASLAVTLAAGWVSWRKLRVPIPRTEEEEPALLIGRVRFMAMLGLCHSALFLLVIGAQALGLWFFPPCAE